MGNELLTGEQVIEQVKANSTTVLLAFSRGKDSIGAWLALRAAGLEVVPFHMYLVPGLGFVDRSLKYYEEFFGCRIRNYPHPSLYRWLNNFVFQAPENCRIIEAARLPMFDYDQLHTLIREDLELPAGAWVCSGVRAVDSPNRRAAVNRFGPMNHKRRMCWPVWDWNKDRLMGEIRKAGVRLPIDYRMFGRSFDGIDRRFAEPLKAWFPEDYDRLVSYFPLASIDIWRARYGRDSSLRSE
jgi:hypothetical protein